MNYPTDPFAILEPRNPSIIELYLLRNVKRKVTKHVVGLVEHEKEQHLQQRKQTRTYTGPYPTVFLGYEIQQQFPKNACLCFFVYFSVF